MNHLLYSVEDKPPFGLSLLLASQHLLAALGGIIAVPFSARECTQTLYCGYYNLS